MSNEQVDDPGTGGESIINYDIEDEPPLAEAIPLGVQHLLAMFLSTVALPLVVAGAVGLNGPDRRSGTESQ